MKNKRSKNVTNFNDLKDVPIDSNNELKIVKFYVKGMHCGNCVNTVEGAFLNAKGVKAASVNLSSGVAIVSFDAKVSSVKKLIKIFKGTQFQVSLLKDDAIFYSESLKKEKNKELKNDLIKLIVAVILTGILFSINYIPGLKFYLGKFLIEITGQSYNSTEILSNFLVNLSCLIVAIPVQFVCGSSFLKGAFSSIKKLKPNMDVLVSLATLVTFAYSFYICIEPVILDVWRGTISGFTNGGKPIFETACLLIVFISFGEFIENKAKLRSNKVLESLYKLMPRTSSVIVGFETKEEIWKAYQEEKNFTLSKKSVSDLTQRDFVFINKNERITADSKIILGSTKVDESMLTGESELIVKNPGDKVSAGTINTSDMFIAEVIHDSKDSTLSKIIDTVAMAQSTKPHFSRLADKIASIFVPVVLAIGIIVFVAWFFIDQGSIPDKIHHSLMSCVSVLIVACPCALVLATPITLTVAMSKGAELGVIIRDGSVLEMLCNVKHIIFDKTGTLTKADLETNMSSAKELRDDAYDTIQTLHRKKINTYMISGDNKDEALRIGNQVQISQSNIVYEVNPLEKKAHVENIVSTIKNQNIYKDYKKIAYVGDGINDAPALSTADIGITLESATDIALESSDIVLMHNKLSDIITAFRLSKSSMRKIKQNLFWASAYNLIIIPLAAFGVLNPVICAAVHAVSSLIVVFNALSLKRFK